MQRTRRDELREEIEALVGRLAESADNLDLHRQLRETAIRHKAAGGLGLGIVPRLRRLPRDTLQRLVHFERLWSFDPMNTDRMLQVYGAIEAHAVSRPDLDFEPARRWLAQILRHASGAG